MRLSKRYFEGLPLERMKDLDIYNSKTLPDHRIRMETRHILNDVGFFESNRGVFIPINIVDISHNGCRVYTKFKSHQSLTAHNRFSVHLPDDQGAINAIVFKQEDFGHFRAVFQHRNSDSAHTVESFIRNMKTEKDNIAA